MFLSTCLKRSAQIRTFIQPKMWFGIATAYKQNVMFSFALNKNLFNYNPVSTSMKSIRLFNTTAIKLQEEKPHDHARLWVIEKATSALLVGLIPFGLLIPNRLFDILLAVLITAHTYWGMEAVMVEYVRVLLFGPLIPKIAIGFVYAMTVLMLGGLFYLIFNDIGLCRAFWRIWRNMRKPKDSFKRR